MSATRYYDAVSRILARIHTHELASIQQAGARFADAIAGGRRVYLFGSGHSVIPVMDVFPRYGSFVGFYPLYDPRLMWSNVIGPAGARELLWIERREGYVAQFLQSYPMGSGDCLLVFSHGGLNAAPIEAAVMVDGARHVRIADCEFGHVGTYGVWFRKGCRDCTLERSYIHDLGAGGVRIGETEIRRNQAEQTVHQIRSMMDEHKDKFQGSEEADIKTAIDNVEKVKAADDKDAIDAALKELESKSQAWGKRIHEASMAKQQAAAGAAGGAGPQAQAEPQPKGGGDENIKDADFTVQK